MSIYSDHNHYLYLFNILKEAIIFVKNLAKSRYF